MFSPTRPYNDLPPLPPAVELETKAVLKLCIEARAALAALKQAGHVIPNQSLLINTIPLMEAQASSEIENIVTTSDRLFQLASMETEQVDAATREAFRYRTALREGYETLSRRPLSTATAVAVCRTIKGSALDIRSVPGTQLVNDRTREAIYTPPDGEARLRSLLSNWERFVHTEELIDPLVRMAVGHYQFEAIHPFLDGNGRTGRVLNILYLVDKGLLDIPVLYLSQYIIQNKSDYYRLLLEVSTNGAWEAWILYMLEAVRSTALWTTAKIHAVRQLQEEAGQYIRDHAPKIYSKGLLDALFFLPYTRIGTLVDAGVAHRHTASRYLSQLAELGVLQERVIGRDKLFAHPRFIELLLSDGNDVPAYP